MGQSVVSHIGVVTMKITFLIAFVSCSSSVFGSWVYSQRPYFHWIKSLNLNNLRTASSPSERVVTSRSTSVRQQARQRQPSFSSFFSEGGQDNRARSMSRSQIIEGIST